MIVCPNCATSNTLGKVFCIGCGQKLPASSLVREDVERLGELASKRRLVIRIISGVLTLWLAICLLLAFWPQRTPYYASTLTAGQARDASHKMRMLAQVLLQDEVGEAEVSTGEINAYLRFNVMRKSVGRNVSVRLDADSVRVRWLLQPFVRNEGGSGGPVISLDYRLKPSRRTGRLRVTGVSMGHLPLGWPLGGPLRKIFQQTYQGRPEWTLALRLSVGKLEPGKITLMTSRGAARDQALEKVQATLSAEAENVGNGDVAESAGAD